MRSQPVCDICGCPAAKADPLGTGAAVDLERDADGLWICSDCCARLITRPEGYPASGDLDPALAVLRGKSAGAICRTSNLPYEAPYRTVIDAAQRIAYDEDRYMSAWSFVTQWVDGTTVWQSEVGEQLALVTPNGPLHIVSKG